MSIDQIHHTTMWAALQIPEIQDMYRTLYPNQGVAFGFTADFSRKLTSPEYRAAYFRGETRALLRLPSGSEVLSGTPNASVHNGPHTALTKSYTDALKLIAADLDQGIAPAEFRANGISPEQAALDYACVDWGARVAA